MNWIYKDSVINSIEDIEIATGIKNPYGFVYIIHYVPQGLRYIGRKYLWSQKTFQKNGKKFKKLVESDWLDYWSSSPRLLGMIEEFGKDKFTREILTVGPTKGMVNYLEEKLQYTLGVLESEDWINNNIRAKVFKKNVIKHQETLERLRETVVSRLS